LLLLPFDPDLYGSDRGFFSERNVTSCKQQGVKVICIPQRGGAKAPEREAYVRSREFKDGQRFRAGIEGRILGVVPRPWHEALSRRRPPVTSFLDDGSDQVEEHHARRSFKWISHRSPRIRGRWRIANNMVMALREPARIRY
jgi:hypothetical protein